MKKYRQTRITVKTREIVSFVKNAANETANDFQNSVCPLCHSPVLSPAVALLTANCSEADDETVTNGAAQHDCPQQ